MHRQLKSTWRCDTMDERFAVRDEALHLVDIDLSYRSVLRRSVHVQIHDVTGDGLIVHIRQSAIERVRGGED